MIREHDKSLFTLIVYEFYLMNTRFRKEFQYISSVICYQHD
jgi:hypothetical protein